MPDRSSPFDLFGDVTEDPEPRHTNPIALMILAEWIHRRDHEDPIADHGFRLVRGAEVCADDRLQC